MKKKVFVGLLLVGGIVGIFLTGGFWLSLPCRFLTVNDPLQKADIIMVLSGGVSQRVPEAVNLYQQGYADRILLAGGEPSEALFFLIGEEISQAELTRRIVEGMGVPSHAIEIIKKGTSTWEESQELRRYAMETNLKRAILVTSHSHSRRVSWTFHKVLDPEKVEIVVVEAGNGQYTPNNWWQSEGGLVSVFTEYVKLFYYLAKYSFGEVLT